MPTDIYLVGLGPGSLDRLSTATLDVLLDPAHGVVARTMSHPAACELAAQRLVVTCDDLYDAGQDFDVVYSSIAERVIAAAKQGPTVYAVPGSIGVGERAGEVLGGWEGGVGVRHSKASDGVWSDALRQPSHVAWAGVDCPHVAPPPPPNRRPMCPVWWKR